MRELLREAVSGYSFASSIDPRRLRFDVGSFSVRACVRKGRSEQGHRYRDVELAYFPKVAGYSRSPAYVYSQVFRRVLETSDPRDAELYDIFDDGQFLLLKSDVRDLTADFVASYGDVDELFWAIFEGKVPSEACLSRAKNRPLLLKNAAEYAIVMSRTDLLEKARFALRAGPWGQEEAEASDMFLTDLEELG